jgi:hypothetical protein
MTRRFSSVRCRACGLTRVSTHRRDFRQCGCPQDTFVDGGAAYLRIGGQDRVEVLVSPEWPTGVSLGLLRRAHRLARELRCGLDPVDTSISFGALKGRIPTRRDLSVRAQPRGGGRDRSTPMTVSRAGAETAPANACPLGSASCGVFASAHGVARCRQCHASSPSCLPASAGSAGRRPPCPFSRAANNWMPIPRPA